MTNPSSAEIVDLKPCPFCGSPPVTNRRATGLLGQVYCRSDDCFGPRTTAACYEDSVKQWNTRTAAQPVTKQLADFAELKLLIDEYNPANSDWNFRRGILLDILVRLWPKNAAQPPDSPAQAARL